MLVISLSLSLSVCVFPPKLLQNLQRLISTLGPVGIDFSMGFVEFQRGGRSRFQAMKPMGRTNTLVRVYQATADGGGLLPPPAALLET